MPTSASSIVSLPARRPDVGRAVLFYALLASLWLVACDWLFGRLVPDPQWRVVVDAAQPWLFAAGTTAWLWRRERAAGAVRAAPAAAAQLDALALLQAIA